MRSIKHTLLFILIFIAFTSNAQQTLHLSQYIFTPLTLNPAYAGYRNEWYVNAIYRKQWVSFDQAPESASVTLDGYINKSKTLAVGANIVKDQLGAMNSTKLIGNVAYTLYLDGHLKNKGISLGLGLGASNNALDITKLVYLDPNDYRINQVTQESYQPDASAGIYYFAPKLYLGASILNVLSTTDNQSKNIFQNTRHLYLNIGTDIPLSNNISLKPFVVYKEDFKSLSNIDVSCFVNYNSMLWLGASYQFGVDIWKSNSISNINYNSEMLTGIAQIFFNNRYRLGYSYDIMINRLSGYQNGSHEVSFGFYVKNPNQNNRISGPRLF